MRTGVLQSDKSSTAPCTGSIVGLSDSRSIVIPSDKCCATGWAADMSLSQPPKIIICFAMKSRSKALYF